MTSDTNLNNSRTLSRNGQGTSAQFMVGRNIDLKNLIRLKATKAENSGGNTVVNPDKIAHKTMTKIEGNAFLAKKLNNLLPEHDESRIDFDTFDNSSLGKRNANISKNLKKKISDVLIKLAKIEGISENEIKALGEGCKTSEFFNKLIHKLKDKNPNKFKVLDEEKIHPESPQERNQAESSEPLAKTYRRNNENNSNDDQPSTRNADTISNLVDNIKDNLGNRNPIINTPRTNLNDFNPMQQQLDNIHSQTEQVKMETEIAKADQDLKNAIMDRDHVIQSGQIGLMQKQQNIEKSLRDQLSGQANSMAQQATGAAGGIANARQQLSNMMDNRINNQNQKFTQDQDRMQHYMRSQQGQPF